MDEQTVKKRGWVKNAAIIFLSIMLVLTFFSNTIMNRSLPEIATAYAESGTINAKIRGTATVTAGESYQVVLDQTRKVETVFIKVGDTVAAGDVLFQLSDMDSDELQAAQKTLDDLQLQYQKAIYGLTNTDYAKANRDIQNAQAALKKAIALRDSSKVTAAELTAAKAAVEMAQRAQTAAEEMVQTLETQIASIEAEYGSAQGKATAMESKIASLQQAVSDYTSQLEALSGGVNTTEIDRSIADAKTKLSAAQKTLAEDLILYNQDYQNLRAQAITELGGMGTEDQILIQMGAIAKRNDKKEWTTAYDTITADQSAVNQCQQTINRLEEDRRLLVSSGDTSAKRAQLQAKLQDSQVQLSAAQSSYNGLQSDAKNLEGALNNAKQQKISAETTLKTQKAAATNATQTYTELQEKKTNYDTAVTQVDTAQTTLEDQIFALSLQKKTDQNALSLQKLDIEAMHKQIASQEETVAKLSSKAIGAEVTASVSGIVSSISVSAGQSTTTGQAMAVIDVTDRGYTASIAVSNEQSKKVKVGDAAEVTNYYWGNAVEATLNKITTDPNNPGKGKLLVFTIKGDISSGESVTLAVGQKSAQYDAIIPTSAVRSDTNGNFVLVVIAKSSPLGNRYVATRVGVNVLAQDDTNTAVSGLNQGDYVVTTSSKPLEAGMQVKMVDNG